MRVSAAVLAGVAAVVVAAGGLLGAGAASVTAETGGDDTGFLTVTATPVSGSFDNLAPGDRVSWLITATNRAAFDTALRLRLESSTLGLLMTDADFGLSVNLAVCDQGWTRDPRPVCAGGHTENLSGPLALVQGGYDLPVVAAQSRAYYLAQIVFPAAAGNDFAQLADDLDFEVTASEATGLPNGGDDPSGLLAWSGITLWPLLLGGLLLVSGVALVVARRGASRAVKTPRADGTAPR